MQERNQKFSTAIKGNRYLELKEKRQDLADYYIKQGKMADPEQKYSLGSAPALVGECMDMCPVFERHEREFQTGGLDKFEKIPGTENVDHEKAVKRYRRSAAGDPPPLPCDVRPPHVLVKTLNYLMQDILAKNGLIDSYSFVRDRARAIRNDLTLQNYRGKEAVELCEKIARYHILTSHELCDVEGISLQQEHEQMRKTLQSLMEFYQEMNEKNIQMPNEAEFQAYYILTHAYSNETASKAETLPDYVFYDPRVQFALEIQSMMARTNEEYIQGRASENGSLNLYSAIFKELEKPTTSYLMACCIHLSFIDIRRGALKAMQKAFYCFPEDLSSVWPLEDLMLLLGFDSEREVMETLDYYEVPYQNGFAMIGKQISGNAEQKKNKGNFTEGQRASLAPRKSERIIAVKRMGLTDVDIILGHTNNIMNAPSQISIPPLPLTVQPIKTVAASNNLQIFSPKQNSSFSKAPVVVSTPKPIPSEAIKEYTAIFCNSIVKEVLHQEPFFNNILQIRLNTIHSICREYVNYLIDQVSRDFVSERIRISQSVSLYFKTLENIVQETLEEVVKAEVRAVGMVCIDHIGALLDYEKSYQRLGWDRWRFCLRRNKLRLLTKQKNAQELLLNLKGFCAVTPKKSIQTPQNAEKFFFQPAKRILFENGDGELLCPLDFAAILFDAKSDLNKWKLSFSVHSTPNIVQNFEQFLNYWIASKLSINLNNELSYTRREIGQQIFHVVTQNVQCNEIGNELMPNHASISSGTCGAVFTLDPYVQERTATKYWKSQSDRLFAFVSALPLQAKIPLLLIYWTDNSYAKVLEDDILSLLGVTFILKDGPISDCQCLNLVASQSFFDSNSLSVLLNHRIRDLIRKYDNIESKLHFDVLADLKETKVFDLLEDLVIRAQEKIYGMNRESRSSLFYPEDRELTEFEASLLNSQARIFTHFITQINGTIRIIHTTVTEFALQCIAYPAKEFCDLNLSNGIRLDWNSDSYFAKIHEVFSSFYLNIPDSKQSGQSMLVELYKNYAKIPQYDHVAQNHIQNETDRILDTYPSSEWLSKILELYTKKILETISIEMHKINSPFFSKTFFDQINRHMYIMQKDTYIVLEEIIKELSNIQNFNFTQHFRNTRKRHKSVGDSPKADDARKKMKDLVALAQKEIENVQYRLTQL